MRSAWARPCLPPPSSNLLTHSHSPRLCSRRHGPARASRVQMAAFPSLYLIVGGVEMMMMMRPRKIISRTRNLSTGYSYLEVKARDRSITKHCGRAPWPEEDSPVLQHSSSAFTALHGASSLSASERKWVLSQPARVGLCYVGTEMFPARGREAKSLLTTIMHIQFYFMIGCTCPLLRYDRIGLSSPNLYLDISQMLRGKGSNKKIGMHSLVCL